MKYLLIFFLSFSAFTFTLDEINTWTIDNQIFTLLYRLQPECVYTLIDGQSSASYSNVESICEKPELTILEAELTTYKNEEIAKENIRLEINAKVETLKTKYALVKDNFHRIRQLASLSSIPNPDAWLRDTVNSISSVEAADASLAVMATMEAQLPTIQAEILQETYKRYAQQAIKCGQLILEVINTRNLQKQDLSTNDMRQILSTFTLIKSELESGSLTTAREDIVNANIAETKFTEADRTAVLNELDACVAKIQ